MTNQLHTPPRFDFGMFSSLPVPVCRVLLLDYDGTLAPFHPDRGMAEPFPGIREQLRMLSGLPGTWLSIISGRPIAELRRLLGSDLAVDIWGCHGWERWRPNREMQSWESTQSVKEALEEGRSLISAAVRPEYVETKPGSIAVHMRPIPAHERKQLEKHIGEHWGRLHEAEHVRLRRFDDGYELCDLSRTKAMAVDTIRDELKSECHLAYLGDDATDEDAFSRLGLTDWPVLVADQPRRSRARYFISREHDVIRFLDDWAHWGSSASQQMRSPGQETAKQPS